MTSGGGGGGRAYPPMWQMMGTNWDCWVSRALSQKREEELKGTGRLCTLHVSTCVHT